MKEIVKMIFYRIRKNKAYLFLPIIVTPIVIALSINFTENMTTSAKIAIVGCNDISLHQSDNINVCYLDVTPPFSDVMEGKYDAVVTMKNGNYSIETMKGSAVKTAIKNMLQGKSPVFKDSSVTRGELSNLTGFIMMFVLLIGTMLYKFYYEEKGGLEMRILSSPISNTKYILSHSVTVLFTVFIPIITIISVYKKIWGFHTNIDVLEIGFIIFLMSLLGSSLGLFISSIIDSDENAVLVGAMSVICTTLLSGSFREIASNSVTKFISGLLPQKYILDYAISLENNKPVNLIGVFYVIILSFTFVLLSLYFNKRRFSMGG